MKKILTHYYNMFEELKLTEDLTIFSSSITNVDNSILVKDFELSCEISKFTYEANKDNSMGLQNRVLVTSKSINKLKSEINDKIISFFNITDDYVYFYDNWVFISENGNTKSDYHDHIGKGSDIFIKELPEWTLLYYAQMPNNLKGDEGVLHFKTKKGEEVSILPKENQVILFKSDILHRPQIFTNSTKKRIVYACNITILNRDKTYNKKLKTLV
jgi:hypothetical protein